MITKSLAQKQEEKESYSQRAANWWVNEIKSSASAKKKSIEGLDKFKNELAFTIKNENSKNGSMVISTFNKSSKILDKIAVNSELDTTCIPSGYEMQIFFNKVRVYNQYGMLVANF